MDSYFADKTILVTGAAGFLGSHLVDALLAAGATVVGVDTFITGSKNNLAHLSASARFTLLEADASLPPALYLGTTIPDVVFHFASPASPPLYQKYPVETYLVNSSGTHHLLSFLTEKNPLARFVFAGTSEAYGDPLVHPQPETYWGNVNPNGVRSCYDESKRFGETIAGVFYRDFSIDTRIVRIFNTYGPRMNPADGRVIPNLVMQALQKKPFTIYGNGTQTRSYCYVSDLIAGILLVASAPDQAGQTFNVGNPEEFSIIETAQAIEHEVGTTEYSFVSLPSDDPTRRQPDISKIKSELGWKPTVSFKEGLKQTIAYFQSTLA